MKKKPRKHYKKELQKMFNLSAAAGFIPAAVMVYRPDINAHMYHDLLIIKPSTCRGWYDFSRVFPANEIAAVAKNASRTGM